MKKIISKICIVAVLLSVFSFAYSPVASADEPIVLKLGHIQSENDFWHLGSLKFKEEVEKQRENTNDSVSKDTNLDIYNNSSNTRKKNNKVNINTATKEELDTLPGIGESTANKIISYREEKGNFKSIEEIKEVSGIGDSKYEQIKNLIEI